MRVEYFPTKNWYISKRNMVLFGVNLNTVKGKTIQRQKGQKHYYIALFNVPECKQKCHLDCNEDTLQMYPTDAFKD